MLTKNKQIHFVGIGGIGMSGIAELLHNLGYSITGSDIKSSNRTEYLEKIGIKVMIGHSEKNLGDCDLLVFSSAVKLDNCEIKESKKLNIPFIKRAEMLGELLKVKPYSIAVAGTHGKTTTSSMLGAIFKGANLDPTIVVGGIVQDFQSNSILGNGEMIIVEADEYDRTLLSLKPTMSIVTNIDLEHIDCYPNIEDLQQTFLTFINSTPFYGISVVYYDDDNIKSILDDIKRPFIKYGYSSECDIRFENPSFRMLESSYVLIVNNKHIGEIELNVPGEHNILNSLAAIGIAMEFDIPFEVIKRSLKNYSGVERRFEIKYITSNNITIVDDYAHHPAEIEATINSAISGWDINNLIIIFQPHLYSRTQSFYKEFSKVLSKADIVLMTEIYGAREIPIKGISSEMIINQINDTETYLLKKNEVTKQIINVCDRNDMIIVMGAGDIRNETEKIYIAIEENL